MLLIDDLEAQVRELFDLTWLGSEPSQVRQWLEGAMQLEDLSLKEMIRRLKVALLHRLGDLVPEVRFEEEDLWAEWIFMSIIDQ